VFSYSAPQAWNAQPEKNICHETSVTVSIEAFFFSLAINCEVYIDFIQTIILFYILYFLFFFYFLIFRVLLIVLTMDNCNARALFIFILQYKHYLMMMTQ